MGERRGAGAVIVALMAVGLVACTTEPAPAPLPTPSALSSEDAAFAAAEATYRAYVDAVNARREDPQSLPDPESFLTGAALADHRQTEQILDTKGLAVVGPSVVRAIRRSAEVDPIRLTVCLDASETAVLDTSGTDVTPTTRAELLAIEVRFESTRIAEATAADDEC
jgi:hypothetical protein